MRSSMRLLQAVDSFAQSWRVGHAVGGQLRQLVADLVQAQAHALGEDDERHPPDHRPVKRRWPEEARSELISPRSS